MLQLQPTTLLRCSQERLQAHGLQVRTDIRHWQHRSLTRICRNDILLQDAIDIEDPVKVVTLMLEDHGRETFDGFGRVFRFNGVA